MKKQKNQTNKKLWTTCVEYNFTMWDILSPWKTSFPAYQSQNSV